MTPMDVVFPKEWADQQKKQQGEQRTQNDSAQSLTPRPQQPKPQQKEPDKQRVVMDIEIPEVKKLNANFETLRASVWETTAKVEQVQSQLDAKDQALDFMITQLTEAQRRLEDKVDQIYIMELNREQKIDNALKQVDKLLESY